MNMLNKDYDNDHISEPRSILLIDDNFDIVILMYPPTQ